MILGDLALPDIDIFDGLDTPSERVTRLGHELVASTDAARNGGSC
jgi:hypothetical protein